jgi:4a-hydroxytetrahydrobiopterin dehydratase
MSVPEIMVKVKTKAAFRGKRKCAMENLAGKKCIPCRGGIPPLTEAQIAELMSFVPNWQVREVDGIKRLERTFKLKNFAEALSFTDQIGAIAEAEDHHPLIVTEWGKVTVQWWTHKIRGLHNNDFIMAAKTDGVADAGHQERTIE